MAKKKYDVIVIGAGPGGATSAALLAQMGHKVLLLEKNGQAGGKAMTVSKNGFRYEYWPICAGPAVGGQFQKIIQKLGLEKEVEVWLPEEIMKITYKDPSGEKRSMILPNPMGTDKSEQILGGFTQLMGVTDAELPEVLRMLGDMVTMSAADKDNMTVKEWLDSYNVPRSFYSFMSTIRCEATMEVPIDYGSASEFLKICQDTATGGGGFYIVGGLGMLPEAEARFVKAHGGDVIFKCKVEKIEVKDGKVSGVYTDKGDFTAPIVISTAGIHPTVLKLVGAEHFDRSYVDYVKDLVVDWGFFGVRYFLDKPVLKYPVHTYFSNDTILTMEDLKREETGWFPKDFYAYMGSNSLVPGMAPKGKQMAWVGGTCPGDPKTKMKPFWDAMEKQVAEIWPEIVPHITDKEYYGPPQIAALVRDQVIEGQGGECFGTAQIVGQCGKDKPSIKSPIRGLFFAGSDAGSYGLGYHQAIDSGIKAAEIVRRYLATHQL